MFLNIARYNGGGYHDYRTAIGMSGTSGQTLPECALVMLILRYGGATTYRRMQPFFLGLIAGQCLCMVLWVAIGTFTGQTNVTPFRF